ncbi:unnamed protein product [Sphagnum balticum]
MGAQSLSVRAEDHAPFKPLHLWRCSSPNSEGRKAVEQIIKWVKSGVPCNAICVTAPVLSDYEDILIHDLKWEGIPFQRQRQTRLAASRIFRGLSATLRLMNHELSSPLLEEAYLSISSYSSSLRRREERRVLGPVIEREQIPLEALRQDVRRLVDRAPTGLITQSTFENCIVETYEEILERAKPADEINLECTQSLIKALQKLRLEMGDGRLSSRRGFKRG